MAKKLELLTPKQYAELHGVAYTTVMYWLGKELIRGAKKQEPLGQFWVIPKDAQPPELTPGPKPKKAGRE